MKKKPSKEAFLHGRTSPEYKKKVEEFARKNYLTVTALIHKALDREMRQGQ